MSTEIDLAALRQGNLDLGALTESADVVEGRDLVEKEDLIGVPFIITSLTYRNGIGNADYVSVEFTTLREPYYEGVFNDGSTGVRRQTVQYLIAKQQVTSDDPDTPLSGGEEDPHYEVKLIASRGLRKSSYTHPEFGMSETFYLA